jgi:apolipoprotein N-acyltransferase
MASQLTESSYAIRPPEQEIPEVDRSLLGLRVPTSSQRAPSGLFRSITHFLSTVGITAPFRSVWFATTFERFGSSIRHRWWLLRCLAFTVSAIAWSGHSFAIIGSLIFIVFLKWANSRKDAYSISIAYYAGATWQIVPGAGTFFGHRSNPVQIIGLWAAVSLVLAAPWAALWSGKSNSRLWRTVLALAILAIPPLGLIGCASPLTAAGLLFPGLGWVGLALSVLVCALLASYPKLAFAVIVIVSLPAQFLYRAPAAPTDWQAVSTQFGGVGLDSPSPMAEYTAAQAIQDAALSSNAKVIVFPETVVSNWNAGTDLFWQRTIATLRSQHKTILVGANISDPASERYLNSIVIRGAEQQKSFLQRVPVPIAMWLPFSRKGVPLDLRRPGTIKLGGRRAAVLICYEHLLVWPVLTSFRDRPDLLLGLANDYWARNTTVPEIQRACLESWARLFAVPMLWAQNT